LSLQPDVILAFSRYRRVSARDPHGPNRVHRYRRRGRPRLRSQSGAAGPQPNGPDDVRGERHRQVAKHLKEIEPQLARVAFVINPKTAPYYDFYLRGAKVVAPSLGRNDQPDRALRIP